MTRRASGSRPAPNASVALTPDDRPRVGYQTRDISGGFSNPDRTKSDCQAGTDMTLSRLSVMSAVK